MKEKFSSTSKGNFIVSVQVCIFNCFSVDRTRSCETFHCCFFYTTIINYICYFIAYYINILRCVRSVTWPETKAATPVIRLHTLAVVTLYRTCTNGTEDRPVFYFYYFFISHVHLPILRNYVSISRRGNVLAAYLSSN